MPTRGGIISRRFFQSGRAAPARSKHKIPEQWVATPGGAPRQPPAKICLANSNTPANTPGACRSTTKSEIRTPQGARRESMRPYRSWESILVRCRGQQLHADGLWRRNGETKSLQDFPALRPADELQKPASGIFILRSFEQHDRLFNGWICIRGDFPSVSMLHRRRNSQREGHDAHLRVTRLHELGCLRNIFSENKLIFHLFVDPGF